MEYVVGKRYKARSGKVGVLESKSEDGGGVLVIRARPSGEPEIALIIADLNTLREV